MTPTPVSLAPAHRLRELAARFWPFARPHRRLILVGLALVAIAPLLDAAELVVFGTLIDDVLAPRDLGAFPRVALAFGAVALATALVGALDAYVAASVGERFLLDLRAAVFRHLHRVPLTFLERTPLGDLVSRLGDDVVAIETLVLGTLTRLVSYVTRILVYGTMLVLIDPLLALVSLVIGPPVALASRYFSRRIREVAREKRRASGAIAAVAEESLGAAALVQSYGMQAAEDERFRREGQARLVAELRSVRLRELYGGISDLIELAGALAVAAAGVWALERGRISLGELLVFLGAIAQLYRPLSGLGRLAASVHAAGASAERIAELLDQPEALEQVSRPRTLARPQGRIDFEAVTYRYPGADRAALDGLSLHARPGEIVAIVGASGAGKSTIARLLARFDDPARGSVRLDGIDLRELDPACVRRNVAVVWQEQLVLDRSALENVRAGRPDADDQEVASAVRAAGAESFYQADARLGQRGRSLSGGQRQRIALARALLRDAPVLVLDEPTTGLDGASVQALCATIRANAAGRSTILITHDEQVAAIADRVVRLDVSAVAEGAAA